MRKRVTVPRKRWLKDWNFYGLPSPCLSLPLFPLSRFIRQETFIARGEFERQFEINCSLVVWYKRGGE